MIRSRFILVLLFISSVALAQNEKPISDQIGLAKRADLLREIDKGVNLLESGDYALADDRFRYVLDNLDVIPANLAFYVGKNSLLLGRYKQSIDWLNKYIQLKGTKGQYYFESVKLLSQAESEFLKTNDSSVSNSIPLDSLLNNNRVDCGPSGLVLCPVCKGKGVIITSGILGDNYRPCPYSDQSGFLTCDEYNKLLTGKLKPKF